MSDILEQMIKNHSKLASDFKRAGNTPMNRYHHGYAEGLKQAQRIMEAENGNE